MRKKSEPIVTDKLCDYGCGNLALFKNSSDRLMCCESHASCPANKKKNSEKCKETYKSGRDAKSVYESMSQDSKDRMKHNKGKTTENYEPTRRQVANHKKSFENGLWKAARAGVAIDPVLRWKRNYIPYIDSFGNVFNLESIHEWQVANLLDRNNIQWMHPNQILLSDNRTYQPDFYLPKFDVYLDPKAKWKGKPTTTYQGYAKQESQLKKIEQFEFEYSTRCVILWANDKKSFTIEGILEKIAAVC